MTACVNKKWCMYNNQLTCAFLVAKKHERQSMFDLNWIFFQMEYHKQYDPHCCYTRGVLKKDDAKWSTYKCFEIQIHVLYQVSKVEKLHDTFN